MGFFNKLIVSSLPVIPKSFVGHVASRYIAGSHLEDAVRITKNLNAQGLKSTIDLLGEDILDPDEAIAHRDECKEILSVIARHQLDANLSLKPTQIGLKLGRELCEENLRDILRLAKERSVFVRLDMEDHTCTDESLEIYKNVRRDFGNVGVVVQAYLRRSEADVLELVKMKANFRLCKGIYIEPERIAFNRKDEIRKSFLNLLSIILRNRCYVGIATHDDLLVEGAYRLLSELKVRREEYEFQTLLGVRERLRLRVREDGHRVRVYVPYGKDWYPYSVRRLKENPTIAGHALKTLFSRDSVK